MTWILISFIINVRPRADTRHAPIYVIRIFDGVNIKWIPFQKLLSDRSVFIWSHVSSDQGETTQNIIKPENGHLNSNRNLKHTTATLAYPKQLDKGSYAFGKYNRCWDKACLINVSKRIVLIVLTCLQHVLKSGEGT